MALDQQSELDIAALDTLQLTADAPQGSVYLNVRLMNQGETTLIRTPRGNVQITQAGRYEVVAGDTQEPTRVTVVEGAARVTGDGGLSLAVGPHQTATLMGGTAPQGSVGPQVDDPFLAAREQAGRPVATYQPPPVVAQMTGVEDLQSVGTWTEAPQYGRVWYPPVESGWVPYRHGHWAYVAPWGWTWVDDARWGFAPYHYGRWVDVDGRWGWVPVAPEAPVAEPPVYAPALVDFIGVAAVGAAVGVGLGLALGGGRHVGWVPLGFREPYVPPYGGSAGYVNRINSPYFNRNQNIGNLVSQRRSFVNNGTVNRNVTTINNYYGNAAGATVAPAQVMQRGQPVGPAARGVTPQQFAQVAQPRLQPPVQPTALTPGVTRAVARQHDIPVTQLARPAPAPGPALTPRPAGRIPLRPVAGPVPGAGAVPHPAEPARPGVAPPAAPVAPAAPARPGAPGPAIRPQGAAPALVPHAATPRPQPMIAAPPPHGAVPQPAPRVVAPQAVPHAATPQPVPQAAAPQPVPHVVAPQAVPHAAAPQPVPHVVAPQAVPHAAAPQPVPHVVAPQPVPHVVAPQAVPHAAAPQPVPHVVAPQPVPHVVAPPPVPHVVAPQVPRAVAPPVAPRPPMVQAARLDRAASTATRAATPPRAQAVPARAPVLRRGRLAVTRPAAALPRCRGRRGDRAC